ncbi:polysaccharide export outer membrane protein [Neorhodopirellula lusitana]|uniref:Polysaccharide export outer membrane protein n=1 Tax=Neorhodopirellula lusitana TaxID=445327 RepID=A0ABY1QH46_9BACT|nr:polysaccharide biosynthesis/export family protein [Neorhodopirellula lusitana]SMP69346.1 polysaccharide export outer membrane protein [Neorhodopirellula lusitana]
MKNNLTPRVSSRNVKRTSSVATMSTTMPAICLLSTLLVASFLATGCRTAASLGLPVSGTSHALLPYATDLRQAGHRAGIATELAKHPLPPHRMAAGDVLVIEPNDFNSPVRLQSDQVVQQDGSIELGDYGRVEVLGMTVQEIQQTVQTRVASRETEKSQTRMAMVSHRNNITPEEVVDYGVNVRLVSNESDLFYVMGEVNAPGSYPLVGTETVLDAVIAAGGLSDKANEHKIILTRPQPDGQKRLILPVCYKQILQLGDVSTNYQLMPGDRIYIPSITIWEDVKQSMAFNSDKSCPHCREYR